LNMPTILAEMHRDPIGAGALGVQRKRDRIGLDGTAHGPGGLAVAGLTDRRTVVDIDAEVNHEAGN